jgi:hypothetical protein
VGGCCRGGYFKGSGWSGVGVFFGRELHAREGLTPALSEMERVKWRRRVM